MATVVNNPGTTSSGNGLGVALGVIVAIVLAILLFMYAIPAIRGGGSSTGGTSTSNSIKVPEKMDINVNTPNAPQ